MGRECDLGASQPGLSASLSGLPYPGRPSSHLPCTRTRPYRSVPASGVLAGRCPTPTSILMVMDWVRPSERFTS